MKLEADIKLEDFRAFMRFVKKSAGWQENDRKKQSRSRIFTILSCVVAGLALSIIVRYLGFRIHWPSATIPFLIFLLAFFYFLKQIQDRVMPKPGGSILGHHSFTFSEQGIHSESQHTNTKVGWSGVQSVHETSEHIFLMLDSCAGYILPKRCFSPNLSPDQLKAFVVQRIEPRNNDSLNDDA